MSKQSQKAHARHLDALVKRDQRIRELEAGLREGIQWANRASDLEISGSMLDAAGEFCERAKALLAAGQEGGK